MRAAPVELNPPSGVVLNTQRIRGQSEAYQAVAYNNANYITDGSAGPYPMTLKYTPPVPAWWAVDAGVAILQKMDAAYNYIYCQLALTPADQDGIAAANMIATQHSAVQTYNSRLLHRLFRLAAGVQYQVALNIGGGNGGTWQYYSGGNHLWLEATAWTQ